MNNRNIFHDLVFISDNRLLAEATGAALISEGLVSSYIHVRNGQEMRYMESIRELSTVVVVDATSHCAELLSRIRRLAQELPALRIIAMGDGQSAESVTSCIESGASTFVLAHDSLTELVATIRALQDGLSHCSDAVIQVVLQRIRELSAAKQKAAGDEASALTEREVEVLELVEQGLLNKEIAHRLGIAMSTVKNHLHAIFEKLHVRGRRQAVRQGLAIGVLGCKREQIVA